MSWETATIAEKMQKKQSLSAIIAASSVGSMIEWYDFYIFGSLATIIATKFFPAGKSTTFLLSGNFRGGFCGKTFRGHFLWPSR